MGLTDKLFELIESKDIFLKLINDNFVQNVSPLTIKITNNVYDSNYIFTKENLIEIEYLIDYLYSELNTGHWSKVPITFRRSYTISTFLKVLILLKINADTEDVKFLKSVMKYVDLGILLGAPLPEKYDCLLTNTASTIIQYINKKRVVDNDSTLQTIKKICHEKENDNRNFEKLNGIEIDEISNPSIETFQKKYFSKKEPLKLLNCINDWPAMKKWPDLKYLINVAGERTVPIEIGSQYIDEDWCQKLMTFNEFVNTYILDSSKKEIGYLAQHNLFDQIPELRNDIIIPDYCCLTENDDTEEINEPDINSWLGPKGTVSPLHTDPKHNLLTQVFGTKQVILFSPDDNENLYAFEENMLSNTSKIDPLNVDLNVYPKYKNAKIYKCVLRPGEILYIPPKWWHHITATDVSFSVSFWWK